MHGRLAVGQAVRPLEGSRTVRDAGPRSGVLDRASLETLPLEHSLAPAWFNPTFVVEP